MAEDKESVDRAISTFARPQTYTAEETAFLQAGDDAYSLFEDQSAAVTHSLSGLGKNDTLALISHNTGTRLTTAKALKHNNTIYAKAVAPFIQAPAEQVAAYCCEAATNNLAVEGSDDPDIIEERISAVVNDHSKIFSGRYKAFPLTNR
jgi:hypothetical protein